MGCKIKEGVCNATMKLKPGLFFYLFFGYLQEAEANVFLSESWLKHGFAQCFSVR